VIGDNCFILCLCLCLYHCVCVYITVCVCICVYYTVSVSISLCVSVYVSITLCLCLHITVCVCVHRAAVGVYSRCLRGTAVSVMFCCVPMKVSSLRLSLSLVICLHQNKLNSVCSAPHADCRLCCHGDIASISISIWFFIHCVCVCVLLSWFLSIVSLNNNLVSVCPVLEAPGNCTAGHFNPLYMRLSFLTLPDGSW